ncbi:thioredoxin-like protein, partial [Lactarius indigo]
DFASVCPTGILVFNDALPEYFRLNTTVIGTPSLALNHEWTHSSRVHQAHSAGRLGPDLRISVLADRNMDIDRGVTFRASYLNDSKGVLRQITTNNLPVGRSIAEALRRVKAFQFTDAHGEVCYANWKEGSKTIRADPLAKLDYFAAAIADGAL